jgi:hypothetical protein
VVVRSGVAYGVLLIDIGSSVDENSHKIRPPIVTRIVKGTDFVLMGDSAIDGERWRGGTNMIQRIHISTTI